MIDTLKLSKRLVAARMPAEQAEALADGLAESLKESYVSREFLDARLSALESRLRTDLIMWMVGIQFGFFALSLGATYFMLSHAVIQAATHP